jgi:hypothetical protein
MHSKPEEAGTSVRIVTRLWAGFQAGARDFSSNCSSQLWGPSSLIFNEYYRFFIRG